MPAQRKEAEPRRSGGGLPLPAILGLIVVLAIVVWIGNAARQSKVASAAEEQERAVAEDSRPKPFSSVPEEVRLPRGAGAVTSNAPQDLLSNAAWTKGSELADAAYDHAAAAKVAKDAKDEAEYSRLAALAREGFDKALEETALFEDEIKARYGEADGAVASVIKTRSRWFSKLREFRGVK